MSTLQAQLDNLSKDLKDLRSNQSDLSKTVSRHHEENTAKFLAIDRARVVG